MFKSTRLLALIVLAAGTLLGYAAASGKLNPFPQPNATAALQGQAERKPGDSW